MIARHLGEENAHRIELEEERELAGRVMRRGDVVAILGHRLARVRGVVIIGGEQKVVQLRGYRVLGFRGDEVHVYGATSPKRAESVRTFTVDRIAPPRLKR